MRVDKRPQDMEVYNRIVMEISAVRKEISFFDGNNPLSCHSYHMVCMFSLIGMCQQFPSKVAGIFSRRWVANCQIRVKLDYKVITR